MNSENSSIVPHGESLRKAVQYVTDWELEWNLQTVHKVSTEFDLSPIEEEFLVKQFVRHEGIGT